MLIFMIFSVLLYKLIVTTVSAFQGHLVVICIGFVCPAASVCTIASKRELNGV